MYRRMASKKMKTKHLFNYKKTIWNLKREDGASAIEFAIVLPVLALLIFGIIEFGVLFFDYLSITHAAREGVRMAAVNKYDNDTVVNRTSLDATKVNVEIWYEAGSTGTTGKMGDPVFVRVTYNIVPMTGYISSQLVSFPTSLSSTATMRLEQNAL